MSVGSVSFYGLLLAGITRSGEVTISVYNAAEKLEFLESSPTSFNPGLMYTGFVSTVCCFVNYASCLKIWILIVHDFLCCVLSVLAKFFLCLIVVEAEPGRWWCYCEPETCQYQNRLSKERCV